ncbi:MAGUK p55 subfamily member 3 isoform X2 [Apteryx rowi]|uniref:MAGUK p55 subfamily member 3 isoform X2 n=1 Tax=Apteryx rowi TaxID=308060 RepID=UPI000E1C6C08|nr:MAGUK p55 subfamily member 3 isoform X2 [Apteryx rowi]
MHSEGLHETLALLTSQLRPDSNHKEEMGFLRDVFSEKSLSYLMKIHEKLRHYERQSPTPVLHSAAGLVEDVIEELQTAPVNNEEKELLQLLSTPHLRAMLVVHDTVAQKNFDPVLPPLPDNFDDDFDEESVKIVRLVKNKEPLGATIRRDEHTGAVIVARIMRGGAADRSGLVHVGDELREVNGIAVLHKRPEEISQILAQSQGSIILKIIPAVKEEDRLKDSKVFMRALFCYNPKEDRAIPCQEAGLPFKKQHILEVVSQDDPTWWQAKRVGDTNLRAGLIPSKQFQERCSRGRVSQNYAAPVLLVASKSRIMSLIETIELQKNCWHSAESQNCEEATLDGREDQICISDLHAIIQNKTRLSLWIEDCDCEGYFNGQYIAGLRRSFRLSRKEKENNQNEAKQAEQADTEEFLTYEEVTKYQQQPGEQQRLVVLIGSLGAKLNELKQKVVSENPQEYGVAVPHTTRSKKSHEKEGVEYNFVSKQSFETDVQQNKFVEHGEYKENLYGTSLEAIRSVMAKKKVCLVDVVPEAVKHLRTPEFKPYVIFVKPLIPEKKKHALKSPVSEELSTPLQDEEQQEIINSAAFIEEQYGHLIDTILVKEDLQSACNQLKTVLEKLSKDSFWVPINWVRS